MPRTAEELNALTSMIIAIAIDIHRALGPGLPESAYLACLCHELARVGVPFVRQKPIPLVFRGLTIPCVYRADIVVDDQVVIEVKALDALAPVHGRQLTTYLRITDCRVGLLLNFGAETMRAGIKRIVNCFPE